MSARAVAAATALVENESLTFPADFVESEILTFSAAFVVGESWTCPATVVESESLIFPAAFVNVKKVRVEYLNVMSLQ